MAQKKHKRRYKRDLLKQLEATFDLERLDYQKKTRPVQGKAILFGVLAAFLVYSLGFAAGYTGWQNQVVDYAMFAKMVWLMMIPASVIGVVTWLLVKNRLEYPVRCEMRDYIRALEGEQGLLWRYSPLLNELAPDKLNIKEMMKFSRDGRVDDLDPEDYGVAVEDLISLVRESGSKSISPDAMEELEENFAREETGRGRQSV